MITYMIRVLFILIVFLSSAVYAQNVDDSFEKAEIHQQKIIEACKANSQPKWNTGNTMVIQEGVHDYIQCLTREIKRVSDVYFVSYNDQTTDDEKEDQDAFFKDLEVYTEQSLKLYEHIHSGPCAPCGTQHHVFYIMNAAVDLENVLKVMLEEAYEYGRPVEPPRKP